VPGDTYTLKDWLREHPPDDGVFKQSVALVAERANDGEDFLFAVRELLDELSLLINDRQRERAIEDEPRPTGDQRYDAYLAALAEHFAVTQGLPVPAWANRPERFLDRFWFVSEVPGFRGLAIVQSPAAFRRRGVFISEGALQRV
jgi:hypothetical protein